MSGTWCSWCGTRIRCTGADTVGTSRSCRTLGPGRNRRNTVPRTSPAPGTWTANGRTGSSDRRSRCMSRTTRGTTGIACRSRTGLLLLLLLLLLCKHAAVRTCGQGENRHVRAVTRGRSVKEARGLTNATNTKIH